MVIKGRSIETLFAIAALVGSVGCGGHQREIRIPESVVANPKKARGDQDRVAQPYVIKMSDGKRTWQIEIPVSHASPSFQAAIPLDLGAAPTELPSGPPTEADKEIIEAKKSAGEPVARAQPGNNGSPPSYLASIARIRALYRRRQYELALMDTVALDRAYPDDKRILQMKGTLYSKLNRPKEAREAWERVLTLDPDNEVVARALEQLNEREGR